MPELGLITRPIERKPHLIGIDGVTPRLRAANYQPLGSRREGRAERVEDYGCHGLQGSAVSRVGVSPAPLQKSATYTDLLNLPEHLTGQIVDGDLYALPRSAPRHVVAEDALHFLLAGPLQFSSGGGPGGWWILTEPEVHMGPHVLVPDLAGWRKSRLPFPPTQGQFTLTPDWVCEVLSPSMRAFDHKKKRRVYAEQKVPHLWFVDPIIKSIDVLRLTGDLYSIVDTFGEDEKARLEPFDAVQLDLGLLWLPEPPPTE